MSQEKDEKRLKVNEQGSPGSVGFAEAKIEQGELYRKNKGKDQELMQLSFLYTERSTGYLSPEKNRKSGYAESESRCCEWPQPGKTDLNGNSIRSKNNTQH